MRDTFYDIYTLHSWRDYDLKKKQESKKLRKRFLESNPIDSRTRYRNRTALVIVTSLG